MSSLFPIYILRVLSIFLLLWPHVVHFHPRGGTQLNSGTRVTQHQAVRHTIPVEPYPSRNTVFFTTIPPPRIRPMTMRRFFFLGGAGGAFPVSSAKLVCTEQFSCWACACGVVFSCNAQETVVRSIMRAWFLITWYNVYVRSSVFNSVRTRR